MAKLQLLGRLGTPGLPLQSFLRNPCSLRVGAPCGSTAASTSSKGSDGLSISASAAASNNESSSSTCSTRGWARYPGRIYRSTTATEKGGVPRAAGLLEIEAPVEMEITSRPSDSTQQATFEAQVKAGRLECGSRGCRPIVKAPSADDWCASTVVKDEDWDNDEAFRSLEARAALYTERRTVRDLEISPEIGFPLDFAEYINDVWQEKSLARNYYEIAMKKNPNDATVLLRYAQFAWKTLGDLDKADELFTRAVEESQSDSDVHAMHALFLWQTDE